MHLKSDVEELGMVVHPCNRRCSGGRDGEDKALGPGWAKS
jgi:hypothetical protein